MSPILTPEKPDIALPWFMPSAETERERDRILKSRFFLVRIAGNGQVWRCRRCNGKHDYLTLMCVPQPWSGMTRGLWAYWKTVGVHGAEQHLPPSERSRLKDLDQVFGPASGLPDLASMHPGVVRGLAIRPQDADIGAYSMAAPSLDAHALGVLEPIPVTLAQRYGRRINMRGIKPAFTLEGVDVS